MEKCRKCRHSLEKAISYLDTAPFGKYTVDITYCYVCPRCGFCNWGFTPEDLDQSHKAWARRLSIDFLDLYSNEDTCRGIDIDTRDLYRLRMMRGSEIE